MSLKATTATSTLLRKPDPTFHTTNTPFATESHETPHRRPVAMGYVLYSLTLCSFILATGQCSPCLIQTSKFAASANVGQPSISPATGGPNSFPHSPFLTTSTLACPPRSLATSNPDSLQAISISGLMSQPAILEVVWTSRPSGKCRRS